MEHPDLEPWRSKKPLLPDQIVPAPCKRGRYRVALVFGMAAVISGGASYWAHKRLAVFASIELGVVAVVLFLMSMALISTTIKAKPASLHRKCLFTLIVVPLFCIGLLKQDLNLFEKDEAFNGCRDCTSAIFARAQAPFGFWVSHLVVWVAIGGAFVGLMKLVRRYGVFVQKPKETSRKLIL